MSHTSHAARSRPSPHQLAPPAGYLSLPTLLLADLEDNPLAIGLWALIGRLFLVAQAPVPLSAGDVLAYDPQLRRGAVVRALARLSRGGWLLAEEHAGHKTRYAPTWGTIAGAPRPWDMRAPMLGRPRHRTAIRIDRRLLDTCMGRLNPHEAHAADIRRYLTRPLLSLADIGAYALAATGRGEATPALMRWGLARGREVAPLPADAALLASVSQRQMEEPEAPALNVYGLARAGIVIPPPPRQRVPQPLIFIPPDHAAQLIGPLIERLIGQHSQPEGERSASGRVIRRPPEPPALIPGNLGNLRNPAIPLQPPHGAPGGGNHAHAPAERPAPAVESAALLRELGVRPAVIAELAGTPAALVQATIVAGRERPHVRDLAGWVVSRLRDACDGGRQTSPRPSRTPEPTASPATLPGDLAPLELEAALARSLADHPAPPALAPTDATCGCDGSGTYLLDVPYGHPQWGRLQPCPCTHGRAVREALAKSAGPALADVSLDAICVDDRPSEPVAWAGRVFSPAEQSATLRHALGRCTQVAARPGRGVCLLGPPGSGKTTLAVAAAKEVAARHGLQARYTSAPALLDGLRREAAERAPATLLDQHIDAPILVLDDLGREQPTAFARARLYRLLDERMRRHTTDTPRITFVTSNLTFAELYARDGALASRLAAHTDVVLCVASDERLKEEGARTRDRAAMAEETRR